MSRLTLAQLREIVLDELDDEWRTSTDIADRNGINGGNDWYRLALVLERLANDSTIELKVAGRVRRFRRRSATT
jgi:hypothetical protein